MVGLLTSVETSYARKTEAERRADIEATLRPSELVVPGHEVAINELSARTTVGRLARLARENGWETKAGHSEVYSGDVLQKNFKVRPGKSFDFWWFQAVKDGVKIEATALPSYKVGPRLVTADELKARITE